MKKNQDSKKEKKSKKAKKRLWPKILLIVILILIIVGSVFAYKTYKNGGGLTGLLATVAGHDENTKNKLERINVLLLGESTGLTDTMIVASYYPKTGEVALLSIPRDTFVGKNKNKALGEDKINSSTRSYEQKRKSLETMLGITIPYYIAIDTEALVEMVDKIGGVMFDVPIDMKYDHYAEKLFIDLKKGYQLINGAKAEQLVRFRHSNPDKNGNVTTYPAEYGADDFGRMRTTREFIVAAMKQTLKVENVTKIKDFINIANKYIKTNMPDTVIQNYSPYIVSVDMDNIKTEQLPGVSEKCNGVWLFIYNSKETKPLIEKLFYNREIVAEDNTVVSGNTTGNSL